MARQIDADDLMVYLHCRMGQIPCDEYGLYLLADVAEYVAKMPTIEAEPVKHGKWIKTFRGMCESVNTGEMLKRFIYKCSDCDYVTGNQGEHFNFCPNCGARMDGE